MKPYKDRFYGKRHSNTEDSANIILSLLLDILPITKSAVDLGCGVGTWLSVLQKKGIEDIQGVDGDWVNQDYLVIPKEYFLSTDMLKGVNIDKKFDLAISLEVAEHLPADHAEKFITTLTDLSDYVLFSAAIPFQGGTNHVNEQWPEYWTQMFEKRDFVGLDVIRRNIWNNNKIPFYYKQNILLYVHKDNIDKLNLQRITNNFTPISLIHPEAYLAKINKYTSLKGSWKLLRNAIKKKFTGNMMH